MVDETKKEEIQEEQEEIIVDLPGEESEGTEETKPEEPTEQEAPVESEEVVEEESEDEEPSEEEEDTESSEDEEESKDKKQFGKRAEKRIKRLVKEKKELEAQLKAMKDQEESWTSADCTKKELSTFLEQLNSKQFKLIEKFFETMPKLSHTVKVTNPNTKKECEIVLEGLQNFFG